MRGWLGLFPSSILNPVVLDADQVTQTLQQWLCLPRKGRAPWHSLVFLPVRSQFAPEAPPGPQAHLEGRASGAGRAGWVSCHARLELSTTLPRQLPFLAGTSGRAVSHGEVSPWPAPNNPCWAGGIRRGEETSDRPGQAPPPAPGRGTGSDRSWAVWQGLGAASVMGLPPEVHLFHSEGIRDTGTSARRDRASLPD